MKKAIRIKTKEANKVTRDLHPVNTTYHEAVPIDEISRILLNHGLVLLQEDHRKWSGFFCGSEGRATFELALDGSEDTSSQYEALGNCLLLSWYRMPSGRFEINSYMC